MSFAKVTYIDKQTKITANNLNAIQDAILENEDAIQDRVTNSELEQVILGHNSDESAHAAIRDIALDAQTKSTTALSVVGEHNTDTEAHNDMRLELQSLADKLNAFLDSDDTTLDELSELITAIKNNQTTISQLTSNKVNVTDIVNNLTTNTTNKPLSAAQGVALKALVDAIKVPTKVGELTNDKGYLTSVPSEYVTETELNNKGYLTSIPGEYVTETELNAKKYLTSFTETDPTVPSWAKAANKPSYTAAEVGAIATTELNSAINTALAEAKASGEFNGDNGHTPQLTIGTVTTLDAGKNATATITGTTENPVLNLGIPKGDTGSSGSATVTAASITSALGYTPANKTNVDNLDTEKADKTYVNNLLSMVGTLNDGGNTITEQYIPTNVTLGYTAASGTVVGGNNYGLGYTERIPVTAGQKIKISFALSSNGKRNYCPLVYVAAYVNGAAKATASLGVNNPSTDVYEYTVPETVTEIVISSRFFYELNGTSYTDGIIEITTTFEEAQMDYTLDSEIITDIIYEYAQEGGYTGTKSEFANKLAEGSSATQDIVTIRRVVGNYVNVGENASLVTNNSRTTDSGFKTSDSYSGYVSMPLFPCYHYETIDGVETMVSDFKVGDTLFCYYNDGNWQNYECAKTTLNGIYIAFYTKSDTKYTRIGSPLSIAGNGTPAILIDSNTAQATYVGIEIRMSYFKGGAKTFEDVKEFCKYLSLVNLSDGVDIFGDYIPYGSLVESKQIKYTSHLKEKEGDLQNAERRCRYDDKFFTIAYSDGYNNYPANSNESYETACKLGFDAIKGDLQVTADNDIVMCHDASFGVFYDSRDGRNELGPTGAQGKIDTLVIHDKTLAEIKSYYMYKASPDGINVKVPTLEEFLLTCKKYGKIAFLTLRDEYVNDAIPRVFELLEKYDMIDSAIINCTDIYPLFQVRQYNDRIMLSHPQGVRTDIGVTVTDTLAMVNLCDTLGNCIYHPYVKTNQDIAGLTANLEKAKSAIQLAKEKDVRCMGCIVNGQTEMDLLLSYGLVGGMTHDVYTNTEKSLVTSASISGNVISFKNMLGTEQFKVTLPVYNGGVS